MTTLKDEPYVHTEAPTTGRSRWLVVLTIALAVLVVAMGAWIVYDLMTQPSVPGEVEAVVQDYVAAWEADDAAITALVTEDFQLNRYHYRPDATAPGGVTWDLLVTDDIDGVVNDLIPLVDWQVETGGDWIVTGDGPWYVSVVETWTFGDAVYEGIATYLVIDDGGAYRIANDTWVGLHWYDFS